MNLIERRTASSIPVLLVLFALLSRPCEGGEAVYGGTVKATVPVQITVSAGASNPGPTAFTILRLVGKSFQVHEAGTLVANTSAQFQETLPRNTRRIYIEVDSPSGGQATVSVQQAATVNELVSLTGGRVVLDVCVPDRVTGQCP